MIIIHQDNVAAFAGAHIWYWPLNPLLNRKISVTTAAVLGQPFYIRDTYTMPPYLGIGVS